MQNQIGNLQIIARNITALGAKRLIILAMVGLSILALVLLSAFLLQRPVHETLYANIDRTDISKISAALQEAGIKFEIAPNGSTISVPPGLTSKARVILAERGLPSMLGSGYELFDKVGSLGMTSFMQEVTRLRATEGELARTIQLMRGIRAARVHIVMADEGSFRRAKQSPSASVILQTDATIDAKAPSAIKHLVSAALPGMRPQFVTIIGSDGTVFASQDDETEGPSTRARGLERAMSSEITESVRRTLAPYLSLQNFQLSVNVRLNLDRKQVTETVFDPNSRVERSVRVTRETQNATNAGQQSAVTVERNIPQEPGRANSLGRTSNEESQKREEVTNYEVSSKTTQSASGGYAIENISLALLINRAAFPSANETDSNTSLASKLSEIEAIVASASGIRKERGDLVKVSVVDFSQNENKIEPEPSIRISEFLLTQSPTFINSFAALCILFGVIIFIVKPALQILAKEQIMSIPPSPLISHAPDANDKMQDSSRGSGYGSVALKTIPENSTLPPETPVAVLDRLVSEDPGKAAMILRDMIKVV